MLIMYPFGGTKLPTILLAGESTFQQTWMSFQRAAAASVAEALALDLFVNLQCTVTNSVQSFVQGIIIFFS